MIFKCLLPYLMVWVLIIVLQSWPTSYSVPQWPQFRFLELFHLLKSFLHYANVISVQLKGSRFRPGYIFTGKLTQSPMQIAPLNAFNISFVIRKNLIRSKWNVLLTKFHRLKGFQGLSRTVTDETNRDVMKFLYAQ